MPNNTKEFAGSERFFFEGRSVEELRHLANSTHQAQFARLLDVAEKYAESAPPAEHPEESITYIGYVVANLSLAYLLTGQVYYLAAAIRWMQGALAYPHWGRVHMADHDLDAGWLLFGLSLGYNWLGAELPEAFRARLRAKLLLQGQRLYEYAAQTRGGWWSSALWQNHNWICYTGLATVAMALSDASETVPWLELAVTNFREVAAALPADGSDHEGPVYWRYGVPWLYTFYALLAEQKGEDWQPIPFLRETFYYRLYLSAPDFERTLNIGDCHDRRSSHSCALYYRIASLYRNGQARWLADYLYQSGAFWREANESLVRPGVYLEAFLEFLWYDPTVEVVAPDALPLVRVFEDIGLVLARSSWQPNEGRVFAFKSGPGPGYTALEIAERYKRERGWNIINAGHAHPDQNSLLLIDRHAYLLVDEGYSQHKLAAHHSTLLVDNVGQTGEGDYNIFNFVPATRHARLEQVNWDEQTGLIYCRGEAAPAYDSALGLESFKRHIWYSLKDGYIVLLDEIEAEQPHTFSLLFQADHSPILLEAGNYSIESGGRGIEIRSLLPGVQTELRSAFIEANTSSSSPQWKIEHTQYSLALSNATPATHTRFLTVLLPLDRTNLF